MGEMRNNSKFWPENLKGRNLGMHVRIILKGILNKYLEPG
jgi:hypothetical protein